MSQARGFFFDGQTSARIEVTLTLLAGQLQVTGPGVERSVALDSVRCPPTVGSQPVAIYLPDGSKCELAPGSDARALLGQPRGMTDLIHRLENHLHLLIPGVALTVFVVWALIVYGVPALAKQAAFVLPPDAVADLGTQTLETLDDTVFHPSALPAERIAALRKRFAELTAPRHYDVEFRASRALGANAIALPSGVIVFTDDMVKLAHDDDELAAVLAHEIGHVEQRHTMRQLLQNSVTALLLALMVGDVSSSSSLAATLPVFMLQMKYSREFETEADDYAATFLPAHGIPKAALAHILTRLAAEHHEDRDGRDFMSSHPATAKRIAHLQGGDT